MQALAIAHYYEEFKMTINEVKKQAILLKAFLKQKDIDIKLSSCYQIIAKMNGYDDWNTMSAQLKKQVSNKIQVKQTRLNLDVEIIEGALYSLLHVACGVNSYPDNFTVNKNEDGEITGFTLQAFQIKNKDNEYKRLEVDGNLKFNTSNVAERKFILGAQLGSVIENILSNYAYEDFSGKNLRGRSPRFGKFDPGGLVKFAENTSLDKKSPIMEFSGINPSDHPKLIKLKHFIEHQEPVADVRIFLIKVKEFLDEQYYVGWGGTHIHIKNLDNSEGPMIAIIKYK